MNSNEASTSSQPTKSIIGSRKAWLFSRKRKSVSFTESPRSSAGSSKKSQQMQDKWRKYVEQQFKTLKKHKRTRWLGRGKRRTRKNDTTWATMSSSSDSKAGQSFENGLEDSTSLDLEDLDDDALPPFEFPPPVLFHQDHKKRKKTKPSSSSTSSSSSSPCSKQQCKNKTKITGGTTTKKAKSISTKQNKKTTSTNANSTEEMLFEEVGEDSKPQSSTHSAQPTDSFQVKRPLNAFMLFSKACRLEFREMLVPAFDSRVVAMVLGHIWRFLSKEERHAFYKEAEKCRALFYEQKRRQQQEQQLLDPKHKGIVDGEQHMKKPMNGFMLFCHEQRCQIHAKTYNIGSGHRVVKQMAGKWNRMKSSEKLVYMRRAEEERKIQLSQTKLETQASLPPVVHDQMFSAVTECEGDYSEGTADMGTTSTSLLKKMGKNNNKRFADSLDTDASQSNSTTQVEGAPDAAVSQAPSNTETPAAANITMDNPKEPSDRTSSSGQVEESPKSSEKAATGSVCQDDDQTSGGFLGHEEKGKQGRKKRVKKKKSRVPRITRRRVSWMDEVQPWDVFDPVSSALCDEDVCTRLYSPSTSRGNLSLYSGTSGCRTDSSCLHEPSFVPRQCASCLSMTSLKQRMESVFWQPQLDLLNFSSLSSSLCDMCPQTVSADVSSSSEDSCLSLLLKNVHLKDHDAINKFPLISNFPGTGSCSNRHCSVNFFGEADRSRPASTSMLHSGTFDHHRLGMDSTVRGSKVRNAASFYLPKVQAKTLTMTKEWPESMLQYDTTHGHIQCSFRPITVAKYKRYKGKGKGKRTKQGSQKTSTPALHNDSKELQVNKRSIFLQADTSHRSLLHSCETIHTFAGPTTSCNALISLQTNIEPTGSVEREENCQNIQMELHQTSDKDTVSCQVSKDQNQEVMVSDDIVSTNGVFRDLKEPGLEIESEYFNNLPVPFRSGSENLPPSRLVRAGAVSNSTGNIACRNPQQTISSHSMATPVLGQPLKDSTKQCNQETTNPAIKPTKLHALSSVRALVTKSESVVMPNSNRVLKRKFSFDSLEAMNSSSKFSASVQSVGSLPRLLFGTDKGKVPGSSQRANKSQCKAGTVSKSSPRRSGTQMIEDLELEYCQRKNWI